MWITAASSSNYNTWRGIEERVRTFGKSTNNDSLCAMLFQGYLQIHLPGFPYLSSVASWEALLLETKNSFHTFENKDVEQNCGF